MSEVRKRCPSLVVLPMDTVWYRSVSDKIEKALKSKLKSEFDRRFGQKNRKVNPHYFGTVEKVGIDDFFVDITNFVEQLLVSNDATSRNEALISAAATHSFMNSMEVERVLELCRFE